MNKIEERLTRCFLAVFPDLPLENLQTATPESVKGWDSVASVTLFATIEEEFAIEMPLEDAAKFVAFDRILAYLEGRLSAA